MLRWRQEDNRRITFPLVDAAAAMDQGPLRLAAAQIHTRVLAVDGSDDDRAVVRSSRRPPGDCGGVGRALEKLAAQTFDVVVSDLGMGGMNGWDLATPSESLARRARHPGNRLGRGDRSERGAGGG